MVSNKVFYHLCYLVCTWMDASWDKATVHTASISHLRRKSQCDVSERYMDDIIIKSQLFVTYYCSFYWVTLCELKGIGSLLVAQRKYIHIWNISLRRHSYILHTLPVFADICWRGGAKYYSSAQASEKDILKYVFTATVHTPASVTRNNIAALRLVTSIWLHWHGTNCLKCDCLGDGELGQKAAFIPKLCMVHGDG